MKLTITLPEVKSFYIREGIYLSVADLSLIPFESIKEFTDIEGSWYYFNRLSVPYKVRNKGNATSLMREVCEWADSNNVSIYNEILPSGDLDLSSLITFYGKYRFKLVAPTIMLREKHNGL